MEIAGYRGNEEVRLDTLLTVVQTFSVVALAVVGLLPWTYDSNDPKGKRLTVFGWVLLSVGAFVFILTTVIKEIETTRSEERLHQKIVEIKDRLFITIASKVMEAPKESSPAPKQERSREIEIKEPQDGSQLPARAYVEGSVSDPQAKVWVIVHPMDVTAYWVQSTVNVKKDGRWKVMVYLGRASDIDVGKQFEIMAITNPKVRVDEGDVLNEWPEAQWKSQVIEVIRK